MSTMAASMFGAQLAPAFSTTPMGIGVAGVTPMLGAPTPVPQAVSTAPQTDLAGAFGAAGAIMSIFGSINSAIGTYYAAESKKNEIKMQAQNQRFAAEMSRINARGAEFGAQQTLISGARQLGVMGMQASQRRASATAAMAGRGIQGGVGSAREVQASMAFVDEMDRLTVNANRIRAAEAQRMQALNYSTQAVMSGVSAQNLMASAGTISPGLGMYTSLLGSAGSVAQSWATNRRIEELLAANSQMRF